MTPSASSPRPWAPPSRRATPARSPGSTSAGASCARSWPTTPAPRTTTAAALDIARRLGDDTIEAQALERLGWTAYYGRDSGLASELAGRAAELAESAAAAPAALPSALVLVGRIRHWAGDIDGAAEAYEEALSRTPDPATMASALSCLGALLEHGDRFAEARRTLDQAAAESTRTGAFRPLLRTLFFAGLARGNLGDFGGALRALERKRRLLEEYDVHFYRARTDTLLSWVWREVGDLGRARDLAEQAVAEAREVKAGSLQVEQELHGLARRRRVRPPRRRRGLGLRARSRSPSRC